MQSVPYQCLKVRLVRSTLQNLISFCDGNNSLLEIADLIEESFEEIYPIATKLIDTGIIEVINEKTQ